MSAAVIALLSVVGVLLALVLLRLAAIEGYLRAAAVSHPHTKAKCVAHADRLSALASRPWSLAGKRGER